ncbi:MAG: lipid A deacylase LpxR family protein [Candidatus Didemnitutus sp.]|nr:lipid A deacylase LpxR family protein [Candidatus Didemnitutus sp.]
MNRWWHAGIALACALSAHATEPAAPETPVVEDSWRLRALVVSFENDNFFSGSDRHYTQGARVTWLYDAGARSWATEMARSTLRLFTQRVEDSEAKLAVSFGQDMFTPENTSTATLIPTDRPYAAWSYLAAGFHVIDVAPLDAVGVKSRGTSLIAEVSLGMVGPAAQGAQLQNAWHDLIKVERSHGWPNQLRDEPGLNLAFEWRRKFWHRGWIDAVPRAALVLGNVQTHASVGGTVRIGPNLPNDFGHDLIRAASGNVARTSQFSAYGFASADARLVGRNIFLDGNTWRDSHAVRKRPVVADFNTGFALNWPRFRLIYTQNYRTTDFYGQPRRDVFGSVSLIFLF